MTTRQIDKTLARRLFLQRYVTQVVRDALKNIERGDRLIVDLTGEFFDNADNRQRAALSRARRNIPEVRNFIRSIEDLLDLQRIATRDFIREELERMLKKELEHIAKTWDLAPANQSGIALDPVGGKTIAQWIDGAFKVYGAKVLADLVLSARDPKANTTALFRGTRALGRTDGLLAFRTNRLLRPTIDSLINGKANQAAKKTFKHNKIELMDWLATLDFRTCPTCYRNEVESPYREDNLPDENPHPNCRCVIIPHQPDPEALRPFVKDTRSVKDIPLGERAGKIGQTRGGIEDFFARMNTEQRLAYMGRSRNELWNEGKITDFRQLINQRNGRPLTLDQLPQ